MQYQSNLVALSSVLLLGSTVDQSAHHHFRYGCGIGNHARLMDKSELPIQ